MVTTGARAEALRLVLIDAGLHSDEQRPDPPRLHTVPPYARSVIMDLSRNRQLTIMNTPRRPPEAPDSARRAGGSAE
jgi:hypothetical protein